jgi:dCMP deaminase
MERRDKVNYYLDIAENVLKRGTCLRRNYGAIIVNNDEIISTGYSGAPRRRKNCIDIGFCMRERLNIPRGQMYEKCRSVHSEANACLSASRKDMMGSSLYLVGREKKSEQIVTNADCCAMCKKLIINSGIEKVIIRDNENDYRVIEVKDWVYHDDSLTEEMGY